jgi:hypothetical protein
MVTHKHKVFISYYHGDDQKYAYSLKKFYGNAIIDKSLDEDIGYLSNNGILNLIRRERLIDSTVTVVLVGMHTYGRKWVDWEIYASLRPYGYRTINGLVGIYLPRHSNKDFRLTDNILSDYAVGIEWADLDSKTGLTYAIHKAWNRRHYFWLIDNSRQLRRNNAPIR